MERSGLGRVERLDVREAWPREATDFTPWLAEHIGELGEAPGLELELEAREASVGTFSLDLLARDSGTGRTVIIENQLEPTNHDHLGKLLTYAGGHDANVIVWVAREFREEHRQALDWLNQRTGEETEFFGVRVEVWRIDDSRPAPHFSLVAAPNEWRRGAASAMRAASASEKGLRYKSFFQGLIDALRQRGFTRARRAQPQNWYLFSVGHAQRVQIGTVFGQGRRVRVELYIDKTDRDWNKDLFDSLEESREPIEAEIGTELEWHRLEERRASRIAVVRAGGIDGDEQSLEEIRAWMMEMLFAFKRVFGPRLDELTTQLEA